MVLEIIIRLTPDTEIGKIKNDLEQLPNMPGHLVRTWKEGGHQLDKLASQ